MSDQLDTNAHLLALQKTLGELHARPSMYVKEMIVNPTYSDNRHQGLYDICDPSGRVVYIGKTVSGQDGVAQRIWDHAKNISGLLNTLGVTPEKFADFAVRTLSIPDSRARGLAEYFAIALHDPRGNRVG